MSALDHFMLAELLATATGQVQVRPLACGLRQGRAVALANARHKFGTVQFVASARLRSAQVVLPASALLLGLMHDTTRIDPAALDFYRQPTTTAPRPFDHTVGGHCLISRLPKGLAEVAARCFPGDGPMDRRILPAVQRVIPQRLQAN